VCSSVCACVCMYLCVFTKGGVLCFLSEMSSGIMHIHTQHICTHALHATPHIGFFRLLAYESCPVPCKANGASRCGGRQPSTISMVKEIENLRAHIHKYTLQERTHTHRHTVQCMECNVQYTPSQTHTFTHIHTHTHTPVQTHSHTHTHTHTHTTYMQSRTVTHTHTRTFDHCVLCMLTIRS